MPATSSPATAVRYRDVAAAVEWLCTAFGFEKQTVVAGEDGAIDYAQLTCGRAMLMLAPVRDTPLDRFMKQPDEIGGAATQSCYLVVGDADAHHARAKAAGAEIVLDLQDDDFGGRGYTCRDPEGHVWMFGTYDPWQGSEPAPAAAAVGARRRPIMLAGLGVAVFAMLAAVVWIVAAHRQPVAVSSAAVHGPADAAKEVADAKDRSTKASEEVQALLDKERAARLAADKAGEEALKRAAEEQRAREAAERATREARAELERERAAKLAAEKAVAGKAGEEAMKRIADERRARETAERAVDEVRVELDRARAAKLAAEKSSTGVLERVAAAEKAAQEARTRLERERATTTAAEMAKEFALARADEERLAREAADKAAQEVREQLERERLAKGPASSGEPEAAKRAAALKASLDRAEKRAAEAQRAKETAEKEAQEAREQLAREQAAKTQAWKVVSQLTKQLKQLQAASADGPAAGNDDGAGPAPKKARPRARQKKAPNPDE
jgi:uncharacterized glyoxalase superfamily protein PhnB